MKWSSVKLGLGDVTSVSRNHQKCKTRMEQPRGQYDVTLVTFWRQTLRNSDSISVIRQPVPYFVSQSSAVHCNSTITAYVISLNTSTQNSDTLHFHVLSQCVWHESSICFSHYRCPIVILNSAVDRNVMCARCLAEIFPEIT